MSRLHNAYLLNAKEAKALTLLLREARYTQVSIERCKDYVSNIVRFYAGASPGSQREVNALIQEACGFEDESVLDVDE